MSQVIGDGGRLAWTLGCGVAARTINPTPVTRSPAPVTYRCSTPPSSDSVAASISARVAHRKSPGIVCFSACAAEARARARGRSSWSFT